VPYHLDTNICAAALKGIVTVQDRMRTHADGLAISTVVLGELYCGAFRSQRVAHNLEVLAEFVAGIEVIPFDTEAARVYGTLCAELLRIGRPTGEKDALIAAIAKHHGATLVTHNTRHFQHIPDLSLEDWLA